MLCEIGQIFIRISLLFLSADFNGEVMFIFYGSYYVHTGYSTTGGDSTGQNMTKIMNDEIAFEASFPSYYYWKYS